MEQKYSQFHELFKALIQEAVADAIEQNQLKQVPEGSKTKRLLDDTLDADEAAKLLRIAKQTLYTLTSKRKIPFYKNGKKILFYRKELEAWVAKSKHEDNSDLTQLAQRYTASNPIKR